LFTGGQTVTLEDNSCKQSTALMLGRSNYRALYTFPSLSLNFVPSLCLSLSLILSISHAKADNAKVFSTFHPDSRLNWMVDRDKQLLLDKKAYIQKLNDLRKHCESIQDSASEENRKGYRYTLLCVYEALGLKEQADYVIAQMEDDDFEASQSTIESYFCRTNNPEKLQRVLERACKLLREKPHPEPEGICSNLVNQGDQLYRTGAFSRAGKCYKEAYELALSNVREPGQTPGGDGSVIFYPFNSYVYFLASQGRLKEAAVVVDKAMDFQLEPQRYGGIISASGDDHFGNFLCMVQPKDHQLFTHFLKRWHEYTDNQRSLGLLSKDGREITAPKFASLSNFSDGLAAAVDKLTYRAGYIDKNGSWIIKPTYIAAKPFADGLAPAIPLEQAFPLNVTGEGMPYSLIDKTGKVVAKLPAYELTNFDGLVGFCYTGEGYHSRFPPNMVDKTGEILFNGCTQLPSFQGRGRYTLFVETGSTSSGCLVSSVGFPLEVAVEEDPDRPGHYKLVQKNIQTTLPGFKLPEGSPHWPNAASTRVSKPPVPAFRKILYCPDGAYLADKSGKRLSETYESVTPAAEDRLITFDHKKGKGLIDSNGKQLIAPKYQDIRPFSEARAAFEMNGLWGFIDKDGREVAKPIYKELRDFSNEVSSLYTHRTVEIEATAPTSLVRLWAKGGSV
jgi:hypothetical protein